MKWANVARVLPADYEWHDRSADKTRPACQLRVGGSEFDVSIYRLFWRRLRAYVNPVRCDCGSVLCHLHGRFEERDGRLALLLEGVLDGFEDGDVDLLTKLGGLQSGCDAFDAHGAAPLCPEEPAGL
jgi:hypothetical protein